jgi:hypothetical protein
MVCHTSGNYGVPFKAGRGVTQGGPLSAKLFNILVDAVAQEWFVRLQQEGLADHHSVGYLTELMRSFFAIFYVDDAYFALRDPVFLQTALDIVVELFERVGLEANRLKTQAMVCTPGKIRTQLPTASYHRMRLGFHTSDDWEARCVSCHHCGLPSCKHAPSCGTWQLITEYTINLW